MKTRHVVREVCFAAVLLFPAARSVRAQLYALQGNVLVSVNETTGVVTSTGIALPADTLIPLGQSVADPIRRRIFLGGFNEDNNKQMLITINLLTSTLSQVEVGVGLIDYDSTTQLLYGVQNSGIVSVDPTTGVVTPLGIPVPQLNATLSGVAAYDPVGHRCFFLGLDEAPGSHGSILTVVSLNSSTVTQVHISFISPFLEYDSRTHLLYGAKGPEIVSIDPATGVVIPLGVSGLPAGFIQGLSSFDTANRRIFTWAYTTPGGIGSVIATISLPALTSNHVPPPPSSSPTSGMLVFVPELPSPMPAANPLLLGLLFVALGLVGTILSGQSTPFSSS